MQRLPVFLSTILFLYFFELTLDDFFYQSIDTYISLLSCSARMMVPLTGMVTSILLTIFLNRKCDIHFSVLIEVSL